MSVYTLTITVDAIEDYDAFIAEHLGVEGRVADYGEPGCRLYPWPVPKMKVRFENTGESIVAHFTEVQPGRY